MRAGRPSLTAAIVAFGRGVGLDEVHRDTLASELSPAPFSWALALLEAAGARRPAARLVARGASLGLVDHAALRMAAIDDAVREASDRGVDQLVILGAGLDTRALRMPELAGWHVYEVDHPATQAYKRAQLGERASGRAGLHLVPVDFERDRLGDALDTAGHDPARPTFWLWEGVTMYLTPAAIDATLREIAGRSAPRSHVALTYVTPELVPAAPRLAPLVRATFALIGEPLVGAMAPTHVEARLASHDFHLLSDTDSAQWARGPGRGGRLAAVFRRERLAVAHREG